MTMLLQFLERHRARHLFRSSHLNPLTPNSDENEISLYIITSCSNIQVMRIKKVITKDTLS